MHEFLFLHFEILRFKLWIFFLSVRVGRQFMPGKKPADCHWLKSQAKTHCNITLHVLRICHDVQTCCWRFFRTSKIALRPVRFFTHTLCDWTSSLYSQVQREHDNSESGNVARVVMFTPNCTGTCCDDNFFIPFLHLRGWNTFSITATNSEYNFQSWGNCSHMCKTVKSFNFCTRKKRQIAGCHFLCIHFLPWKLETTCFNVAMQPNTPHTAQANENACSVYEGASMYSVKSGFSRVEAFVSSAKNLLRPFLVQVTFRLPDLLHGADSETEHAMRLSGHCVSRGSRFPVVQKKGNLTFTWIWFRNMADRSIKACKENTRVGKLSGLCCLLVQCMSVQLCEWWRTDLASPLVLFPH